MSESTVAAERPVGRPRHRLERRWPPFLGSVGFWAGVAVAVYAGILIHSSVKQYDSFNEGLDFATLNQAWYLTAHAHFNPWDSLAARPFLADHGEFIMFLQAPFWWIFRSGLTLAIFQDLELAGCVAVAASWVAGVARRRGSGEWVTAVAVALPICFCLFNPWLYEVIYQDIHFQPLIVLLALAAGRDLHFGHRRRAVIWVVLALLCGDVACTVLIAVGLSLVLAAKGARRDGAVLVVVGALWLMVIGAIHDDQGSLLVTYRYLTDHPTKTPSVPQIVKGLLTHPGRGYHRLRYNTKAIVRTIVPNGGISWLDPLAVVPVLSFIAINGLSSENIFIRPGFQDTPIYIFGALGAGMLVAHLAGKQVWRTALVVVAALALTVAVLVDDIPKLRDHANRNFSVAAAAAHQLSQVQGFTPRSAEVVTTFGTIGRFAQRPWVYVLDELNEPVPVKAHQVEFIFAMAGNQPLPTGFFTEAAALITGPLHGHLRYSASDVRVYTWNPAKLGGTIVLP